MCLIRDLRLLLANTLRTHSKSNGICVFSYEGLLIANTLNKLDPECLRLGNKNQNQQVFWNVLSVEQSVIYNSKVTSIVRHLCALWWGKLLREFVALSSEQYVINHFEGHTLSNKGKTVLSCCSLTEHRYLMNQRTQECWWIKILWLYNDATAYLRVIDRRTWYNLYY